jgi:cell wall-associated NlpC family hydrolase
MLASDRVLFRRVGTLVLAATIFGSLPQPAHAQPGRTADTKETAEAKKAKRKRGGTAFALPLPNGTAFATLPKTARRSRAEIAVATAKAQLGKPYRYGSTGPSSFDCSGLMRFAYAAAGVHLPRSSRSQFGSLRRVPLDALKPGDLVYRPGHIGMYIGKGRMVHAPQTGRNVEIAPLSRSVGAVRPS